VEARRVVNGVGCGVVGAGEVVQGRCLVRVREGAILNLGPSSAVDGSDALTPKFATSLHKGCQRFVVARDLEPVPVGIVGEADKEPVALTKGPDRAVGRIPSHRGGVTHWRRSSAYRGSNLGIGVLGVGVGWRLCLEETGAQEEKKDKRCALTMHHSVYAFIITVNRTIYPLNVSGRLVRSKSMLLFTTRRVVGTVSLFSATAYRAASLYTQAGEK
jgi:hypothetical protein